MADNICAPPGTEGDMEINEILDKQAELEKNILTLTINLDDGTKANVFTRHGFNNNGFFVYTCNICKVPNLASASIQVHINGKKHQSKLLLPVLSAKLFYSQQKKPDNTINKSTELCLAPGEPVPPGFEGEVKGVTEIQLTLDEHKGALIGLEYLAELTGDQREALYVCTLCDKKGDPRTVMAHLNSYNHRLWYLELHYPTLYKVIAAWKSNKEYKKVVPIVVQNVVEAIETKYGRLTPFAVDKDEFEGNKGKYYQEARNEKHFTEKTGPMFLNLVNKTIFEDLRKKQQAEDSQNDASSDATKRKNESVETSEKKIKTVDNIDKAYDDISSISSSSLSRSRSRSRSRMDSRSYRNKSPSKEYNRKYPSSYRGRARSRSKSYSPARNRDRYYRSNNYRSRSRSRSGSKSESRNDRSLQKPVDRDLYRKPRRLWESNLNRGHIAVEKVEKRHYVPPTVNKSSSIDAQKRQIVPTPKELSQQASKLSVERYNLEKYRFAVEIMESEMEKVLAIHEKSPEKHPLYPEEWKKFWNRRYKELQAENKDPTKHDFKTEWIKFWTDRMKQLHNEELEKKHMKLREKYNIKENAEEQNVNILKEQYLLKVKPPSHIDSEIIISDDEKPSDKRSVGSRHSDNKRSSRSVKSASPWDDDDFEVKSRASSKRTIHEAVEQSKSYDEWAKEYYGPNKSKSVFIRELRPPNAELPKEYPALDPSESLNIISVLRLLTALEDLLGSLGPKVINMLSSALAMEKAKANSAEDLLLNDENNVMFETVKEKLKGQLFAGILEPQKVQPVKTAIQKIASLLHQASEKQKQHEEEERKALAAKKLEPVSVPGVGAVDKAAIAKQIAAALVAQGKPNVTTDELEQLINAVVGMTSASQSSSKPLTTAAYLAQFQNPTVCDEINSRAESPKMMKAEEEMSEKKDPMDGLSDSDLKTLLQNFSNLSNDEQHGLIMYLKKLEAREPARVENLRKFVNVEQFQTLAETKINKLDAFEHSPGQSSPFSNREGGTNPSSDITFNNASNMSKSSGDNTKFEENVIESDDDDDYSYEDVFRAASKNVKEKQLQKDLKLIRDTITRDRENAAALAKQEMTVVDATSLIANLMSSLQNKPSEQAPVLEPLNTRPSSQNSNSDHTNTRLTANISEISTAKPYTNILEPASTRMSNMPRLQSNIMDSSNLRYQNNVSEEPNMKAQSNFAEISNSRHSGYSDAQSARMTSNYLEMNNTRLNSNGSDLFADNNRVNNQYNRMESGVRNFPNSFANDNRDRDSNYMQNNSQDKNFMHLQGNNNQSNRSLLSGNAYDQNKPRDSNFLGQNMQSMHHQGNNQPYSRNIDINNFNIASSSNFGNSDQNRFNIMGSSNMDSRYNVPMRNQANVDPSRFSLNNQDYNNRSYSYSNQSRFHQNNNRFNSRGRY